MNGDSASVVTSSTRRPSNRSRSSARAMKRSNLFSSGLNSTSRSTSLSGRASPRESRSKERQPAHTERPDLGFGSAQAGDRIAPGQRFRRHRFNLRVNLRRANRGWWGTIKGGLAATLEAPSTADAVRLGSGYARRSSFGVRSPTAATEDQAWCCRGSSRKRPFELLQRERRAPLRLRGYRWPKRSPLLLKDLGVVHLRRR